MIFERFFNVEIFRILLITKNFIISTKMWMKCYFFPTFSNEIWCIFLLEIIFEPFRNRCWNFLATMNRDRRHPHSHHGPQNLDRDRRGPLPHPHHRFHSFHLRNHLAQHQISFLKHHKLVQIIGKCSSQYSIITSKSQEILSKWPSLSYDSFCALPTPAPSSPWVFIYHTFALKRMSIRA